MSKSAVPRIADVRAVYNAVAECRELGDDPGLWRTHYARRLAVLVGADAVNAAETALGPPAVGGPRSFRPLGIAVSGWDGGFGLVHLGRIAAAFARHGPEFAPMYAPYLAVFDREDGATRARAELVPDAAWDRAPYTELHRAAGLGELAFNFRSVPGRPGMVSDLALARAAGAAPFTAREKAVVREAQALVGPLAGGPLASYQDPSPAALPPRLRAVLRCLLEGDTDKQVAARLGSAPIR